MMEPILSCDFNDNTLCDAMIAVMCRIRPDFPSQAVREQLTALVDEARAHISPQDDQEQQLEQLMALFYDQWGLAAPAEFTAYPMPCGWIMC